MRLHTGALDHQDLTDAARAAGVQIIKAERHGSTVETQRRRAAR